MDLGLKKWKKEIVHYNQKLVITEFFITEFHCILPICKAQLKIRLNNYLFSRSHSNTAGT